MAPLAWSSLNNCISDSPLFESRLPVGSSASRIAGRPVIARAHRDELLMSAGKRSRPRLRASGQPDTLERGVHARAHAQRRRRRAASADTDVLVDRHVANQVEALKDEPDVEAARARVRSAGVSWSVRLPFNQ